MKFGECIDIFTFQNISDNSFNFNGLQNTLKKNANKFCEENISRFIFYLFNIKRYFENIKGRKGEEEIY